MTISYEIKSQLAKLLAAEDLIVEHKRVETAQFNVNTRILTLPVWDTAVEVYDMLVSHEVGHALYTPDRDWFLEKEWFGLNPSFVNIVEDARIEKMMKRRYEGISKTFYKGYTQLVDDDFFDVEGKDISLMNLADRVNLYYKIGTHINIPFTDNEKVFIRKIDQCETFDQVLSTSKELFDYCQAEYDKAKEESESQSQRPDLGKDNTEYEGGEGESETNQESTLEDLVNSNESNEDTNTDGEQKVQVKQEQSNPSDMPMGGSSNNGIEDELKVETVENLDNALKNLAQMEGRDNVYVEIPKLDIEKIIIPNEVIHEWCEELHSEIKQPLVSNENEYYNPMQSSYDFLKQIDEEFAQFKKEAQKEVNYLVKEFECKKAASAYARATTARTGILDCSKLHTYKYNEDLFRKISVVPDGKNHGLIFILDWSGSMAHVMQDTIKQLYNLIWFCKKVQIPFEVYAFTNSCPRDEDLKNAYQQKRNLVRVEESFSLMNLFSSKVRNKELNQQLINIFRVVSSFRSYHGNRMCPTLMNLSGTPLNETVIALHEVIPYFKKESGVEKVNCVILTDGEAQSPSYHREVHRYWEEDPYLGSGSISEGVFLRNRKTGRTHAFTYDWISHSKIFLKDICETFPDVNFVGIRILEAREASRFIRFNSNNTYTNISSYESKMSEWKRNKSIVLSSEDSGFSVYLGLSSNAIGSDTEFEVQDDATKAQIKKAFTKSLKGKKMNKKILSKFIEMVA
tara:strand:- start:3541 stop:5760 length:2220 start_codon:yes stop_codon:yes gene_type:complete